MKKVISNASPLIALSNISQLELLEKIFKKIIIPEAVYKEVVEEGKGRAGAKEVEKYVGKWIELKTVKNIDEVNALRAVLDYGEAEVIALGQEINADLLILDNKEPRLFAKHLGFKLIGTVGILLLAYEKELLENPIGKLLELRENGFYISDRLMKEVINHIKKEGDNAD
jgi:predicted nucleic acid-binding protein